VAAEAAARQASLNEALERADIVFHAVGLGLEVERQLGAYCERAGKPLVPLPDPSLLGLEEALVSWCPLS
jgi:hypothetical protein